MSDVLTITWSVNQVELRQIPSNGSWHPRTQPIRSFTLQRPTRGNRLKDSDSGGGLHEALTELLKDVEITLPVWFLAPNNWIQTFRIDTHNLSSDDLKRSHLIWEVQQRLSGDISDSKIILPGNLDEPKVNVHAFRADVLNMIVKAINRSGLDYINVGFEPEWDGDYNFESPVDLRDCIDADSIDTRVLKTKLSIPIFVSAPILVITLITVSYLLLRFPTADTGKLPVESEITSESPDTSIGTPMDTLTQAIADNVSPINEIARLLPAGAKIQLGVFSPVDFKMEVSGLADPQTWVNNLKQTTSLKWIEIAGSNSSADRTTTILRQNRTGWQPGSLTRNLDSWKALTAENGMNPKGRSARGAFESALMLLNALWDNPRGFEKIYFAPDGNEWVVTVQ